MWIKYVINSRREKNRRKSLSISVYTSSSITTTTTKMAEKEKKRTFTRILSFRFQLTVIRLVSVCVSVCLCKCWVLILLQARTYHQTSSKPKMAFSFQAPYVYNEDTEYASTVMWSFLYPMYGPPLALALSPYPFLCWHLCSHKRRIFYTMLNSISLYFRTANNE